MKLYKSINQANLERDKVQALKINLKDEEFPEGLLDFPLLEELYLEGLCRNFPSNLSSWERVKIISIKLPHFTGDLSSLFSLPRLENLKIIQTPLKHLLLPLGHAAAPIYFMTIKDCDLKILPDEISLLGQLKEVNLSGNKLSSLPQGFQFLTHLKRLNLDGNQFHTYPQILQKLPHLSHLSIDGNQFSQEEKERIQREFHIWVN